MTTKEFSQAVNYELGDKVIMIIQPTCTTCHAIVENAKRESYSLPDTYNYTGDPAAAQILSDLNVDRTPTIVKIKASSRSYKAKAVDDLDELKSFITD